MRHNQHSATIDMTFLALVHTVLFTSQLRLLITRRKEDSLFTCWLVKLPNDQCNKQFITARKRSLRRLSFHRCLSPMGGGSGPLHAGTPPLVRHPHGQTPPWPDIPLARLPWPDPPVDGQTSPLGRHPLGWQPPCAVHAGIRSTRGQYASHWNAFFFGFYRHTITIALYRISPNLS